MIPGLFLSVRQDDVAMEMCKCWRGGAGAMSIIHDHDSAVLKMWSDPDEWPGNLLFQFRRQKEPIW